ncbi:MAG: hypothetical protein ABI315_16080 [Bacteroidia bacterium]
MKKSILIIAISCGITSAFAQDLTSKKGEPILPEADDWAISMNVDPFFRYIGNAFNGSLNNSAPNTQFLHNQAIIGKKFIDEKNAYRVLLRIGLGAVTDKNDVINDAQTGQLITFPDVQGRVVDKRSSKATNIAIGVGKEMRRGKTRLQGYYGADAMLWVGMSSQKFTYGNLMSATTVASTVGNSTTTTPTTTDFNGAKDPDGSFSEKPQGSRIIQTKSGITFGLGLRGFIGAEYFILPKISIGAEYGWGLGLQMTSKGKTISEEQGGTPNQVAEIERKTSGKFAVGVDTDINESNYGQASLKVSFHF